MGKCERLTLFRVCKQAVNVARCIEQRAQLLMQVEDGSMLCEQLVLTLRRMLLRASVHGITLLMQ